MKVKLLKAVEFRGKKYKKNSILDIPAGIANKLILESMAKKA